MLRILTAIALLLLGLYFVIRLLELDRINRDTPGQEDPLLEDDPEA